MNATFVGIIVFLCTFGGVLFGMSLRRILPDHHLDAESKDTVKVGIGLIATMTALVLGLVTASAKNSYDAVDAVVRKTAIDVLVFDRVLARYGPETGEIRKGLRHALEVRIDLIWPRGSPPPANLDVMRSELGMEAERIAEVIRALKPRDNSQRALQSRAIDLMETLLQAKWLVLAGSETSIPLPFLLVLLFWLTITFASFGIFAPRNVTVLIVLFVCALSVSSALFLVIEMDTPFHGLLRVSPDPLRHALAYLNR
jgi:hypothetical protein